MKLTDEQLAVIDTQSNLVINAVAGSGKTTTLIEYAKSRPSHKKILYLAFNKSVKTEAIQRFDKAGLNNVKVETAHSLAYDHVIKYSKYDVAQSYKTYEWCEMLGIKTADKATDFVIASHVNKFISYFCNSNVSRVQDLNYSDVVTDPQAKQFVNHFYKSIEQFARKALSKMDKGEIAVTHDFYLKKFQLSKPQLPYDYILFDEGQDASPAMLDVFLLQDAVKVIVGDAHQQIYGWRYAINSLQKVDFPVFNLSSSFRFDDEIALVANKVLAWKKHLKFPPAVKLIGKGEGGEIIHTKATLGRTNLSLLVNAIAKWQHGEVRKIYFEGNISSYTFADEGASIYDVLNLYNGKPEKIRDKMIATMSTMRELEEYIKKSDDNSLAMIVDVVKEFGNRLPSLINELKRNHTDKKEEADMIFSTVHRCKGMEYDEVTLLDDFTTEEKLKRYIAQGGEEKISDGDKNRLGEEINILYVAATRAKNRLIMPPGINPLRSVQLGDVIKPSSASFLDDITKDWSVFDRHKPRKPIGGKIYNHGKHWTEEEEQLLGELYGQGKSAREIAKSLCRGERGVMFKLREMGQWEGGDIT